MINHPMIMTQEMTCEFSPEQYEGRLKDGRWFYLRMRWGLASLAVGYDYGTVMGGEDVWLDVDPEPRSVRGFFLDYVERDATFAALLEMLDSPSVDK